MDGEETKRHPLPKICHTYPTMMKLRTVIAYLKKIQKIWITWHAFWVLLISLFFLLEISKYFHIKKYRLTYFESLKIFLINMVTILMISAKKATLGLLKIKLFWNKDNDVIIFVHDVTNKILLGDLNYIVDVFMWPTFGNSNISVREVTIISILKDLTRKTTFFDEWSWFKFSIIWDGHNNLVLRSYTNASKMLKLKVKKFWRLNPTFVELAGEKMIGREGFPLPHSE